MVSARPRFPEWSIRELHCVAMVSLQERHRVAMASLRERHSDEMRSPFAA